MKKYISLLMAVFFTISLTSCGSTVKVTDPNAGYSIEKKGRNYYLVIDEAYIEENNNDSLGIWDVAPDIEFSSVKEMRDSVLGGKLTDVQKRTMAKFTKDENGKIELLDFNNLYEAKLPSDFGYKYVSWSGSTYVWVLKDEAYLRIIDKDEFDELYQRRFVIKEEKIIAQEEDTERNGSVKYYNTDTAECKSIQYKLEIPGGYLYINEEYLLSFELIDTFTSFKCSDTIPQNTLVLGEVDGVYFFCYMNTMGFKERPSVEWLSSFGLEKMN